MINPSRSTIVNGRTLFVKDNDYCSELYVTDTFEHGVTNFAKNNIKEGEYVIDVGAHIGYYTLLFSKLVGETGLVAAFEPDDSNYEYLTHNVKVNHIANVICYKHALMDYNGMGRIVTSSFNSGDSRVYRANGNQSNVFVEKLDSLQIDKLEWIKMDIQGCELFALKGAEETIDRFSPRIIMEFERGMLTDHGVEPRALLDWISVKGYQFERIDEHDLSVSPTNIDALLGMDTNLYLHK